MKKTTFLKTLLMAVGLCMGGSAWADDVASYNFEDGETQPFTGRGRQALSFVDDATNGTKVLQFKAANNAYNGFALADYDFSSSVADASTVKIEFDFFPTTEAVNAWVNIADAALRAQTPDHGGFGTRQLGYDGIIFRVGTARMAVDKVTETVFAVNNIAVATSKTTKTASDVLGHWLHVSAEVDIVGKTVDYTVKLGEDEIASGTDVAYVQSNAGQCTQMDFSTINNNTVMLMDNLTITKTVTATNHSYAIKAVSGGTTLKTFTTGIAAESADYSTYIAKVVKYNNKYYVLDDAGNSALDGYLATYTMSTSNATKEINYTLDESIVYFAESNEAGVTSSGDVSNDKNCSSGNYTGYYSSRAASISIADAGVYRMETNVRARIGNNPLNVYDSDDNVIATIAKNSTPATGERQTSNFRVAAESSIKVGLTSGNSLSFDYILIRKIDLSAETAAFNALKDYADALVAVANDNAAANSTLSTAISDQAAAVAAATTAEAITTATSTLLSAMNTYVAAANPTAGNQFDLSYLLTNPNLEDVTDWGDAAAQGWFTDIPRSGVGQYNNFAVRTNLNSSKNGVERYTSDAYITAGTYALYQKVTLPAGNYSFEANAFANNASSIVMAAGSAEGDAVTATDFTAYTVDFTVVSESETKMGVKISATGTNACNWMAITEIKLYKEAANQSVTVTDAGFATYVPSYDLDFSATSIEAYKVKVNKKGVATLTQVDEVPAGTPVLLYKDGGATENIPVMTGAAAVSDNDLVAGTGATVATTDGDYTNMILNYIDSKIGFYFANDQIVATNRAYLHIATSLAPDAESEARMVMVFADEETTGISDASRLMDNGKMRNDNFFNLNGQRVEKPVKGLYIKNGKKVVMK